MVLTNPQLLHLNYHCNILSAIERYLSYVGLDLCNIISLILPIFTIISSSIDRIDNRCESKSMDELTIGS